MHVSHTTPKKHPRGLRRQLGQGMSEYLIIVALIAVAAVGVVGLLGGSIQNQMAAIATEIAGDDGNVAVTAAATDASAAQTQAAADQTLKDYATTN